MKIDGEECEFETGSARAGWVDLFKIGKDVNGRRCRVSRHSVPETLLTTGGRVKTGGHEYEFKKGELK